MKYLLVIGAGENQLPIIKTAKSLGCYVYVVTIPGDYPGIEIADEWIQKDIFAKDEIIDYFLDGKKTIDGVVSDQSDMAAPIVAYIAEKLGLPTWGYDNSLFFTDKSLMRELFQKIGLSVPKNRKVLSEKDAVDAANIIGFPVVFKPTNSFSSRGISLVESEKEVISAYHLALENSRNHEVVVEKYISGKQYFSQGFISNYKLNMFAFSDRYYYDLEDVFIPYTNAFPALISERFEQRMVNDFQKIIDELKPRFGHVWAEWIFDEKNDELYIVEIAIRGGGAHVTDLLIPLAYGVDTQPLLVKEALGEDTAFYNFSDFNRKAAAFYSFILPEGEIISISGIDKVFQIPGVVTAEFKEMKVGDVVNKVMDKRSRYGLVVVSGENRDNLENTMKQVRNVIQIKVKTINGIKDAIWE